MNKREHTRDEVYADATHILNFPLYTNAFDVRANLQKGGFSLLAEYAQKTDDPTTDKNFPYIYRKGYVAMLSTSYSKKGMSLLLQAKRSDNMTFRSLRKDNGTASYINHLQCSRPTPSRHSTPTPHSPTASGHTRQNWDTSSSDTHSSEASTAQE